MARVLWWIVPASLLVLAAYQLSLVLRDRTDENVVGFVAILVMLVGAGLAVVAAGGRRPWVVATYAPAAGIFLVMRFYTYDPYYGDAVRRYSDGGNIDAAWVFVALAGTIAVGLLTWFVPRKGALATAAALVILALMTLAIAVGH
jgi:hypothetical protein